MSVQELEQRVTAAPAATGSAADGAGPADAAAPDANGSAADGAGSGTPVRWVPVCRFDDLLPERGAAALVAGDQVALVRTHDGAVHAVANLDPFSAAHVISRGIVGSRGDVPTIASPMYKQVFNLLSGACLDTAGFAPKSGRSPDLRTWPVDVVDGVVLVGVGEPDGLAAQASGTRP